MHLSPLLLLSLVPLVRLAFANLPHLHTSEIIALIHAIDSSIETLRLEIVGSDIEESEFSNDDLNDCFANITTSYANAIDALGGRPHDQNSAKSQYSEADGFAIWDVFKHGVALQTPATIDHLIQDKEQWVVQDGGQSVAEWLEVWLHHQIIFEQDLFPRLKIDVGFSGGGLLIDLNEAIRKGIRAFGGQVSSEDDTDDGR